MGGIAKIWSRWEIPVLDPTRATVREKGGLFPLPVLIPSGLEWDAAGLKCSERSGLSVQCWTAVACEAINALYGLPNVGKTRVPTKIHRAVFGGSGR